MLGLSTQLFHTVTEMYETHLSFSTDTHIFHIVLHAVLLQVRRCLSLVEPLCGIQIRFLEILSVDLQFVVSIGAQVHWKRKKVCLSKQCTYKSHRFGCDFKTGL